MKPLEVRIAENGQTLQTWGLSRLGHPDLRIVVRNADLVDEIKAFLQFVVNYLNQNNTTIKPGETLAYGYWLMKFETSDDGVLEVLEYNAEASEFVPGVDLAITYWKEQHAICKRVGAKFDPPRPDQKVAISLGIYEGDSIEGVRYPSPDHMSGWWFIGDRYDGNIKSLQTVHLYHVTAARPDLARFVALPCGYRFDTHNSQSPDVWFDEAVMQQRP